jgi:ABC-type multidrug transport system fused ATPase/permease subunit
VMEAVRALHGTKTIVIVAHRLSTVEQCDRLFRLDDGRIVDVGTPTTLVHAAPTTGSAVETQPHVVPDR